ncbi:MAG: hypothetical protein ACT4OJ_06850 [Bacteroidota bacterium]
MDKYSDQLKGNSVGKGCIRYTKPDKIGFVIVQKLLEGTFRSTQPDC